MSGDCSMQYNYNTEEIADKYKIDCNNKTFTNFENFEKFNNDDLLNFVNEKYGNGAFSDGSPFIFKDDYIDESNEDICNPTEYSLKPQQKFVGQFINPSTNFKNSLVFHGLGSGKTCTSLVVGEAFKNKTSTKLLYVVPAPLVDQYYDEIIGELKKGPKETDKYEIWSCTSQCVINDKRDFYTNVNKLSGLKNLENVYSTQKKELELLSSRINKLSQLDSTEESLIEILQLKTLFSVNQNTLRTNELLLSNLKDQIKNNITKVFEITSHDKFINRLFTTEKDGSWTPKDYLTNKNSPLLSGDGLLVIDEIQRMVSENGILYKKLNTAIYQYFHPDLRTIVLSATPIYDNPYEFALTMNLLRPRVNFPTTKRDFYSFFLGKYDEKTEQCMRESKKNNFITYDSCLINKDLLCSLTAGYVSYFRGGNPNAYPYKRIITLEHRMGAYQKEQYISALASDIKSDPSLSKQTKSIDEYVFDDNTDFTVKEDTVSGIYTTTQQFSNIALPIVKSDEMDNILSKKSVKNIKSGLTNFKNELKTLKPRNNPETTLNYIRSKQYSQKFVSIIELSLLCNGPVFIFSNWLQFGVEALSIILNACGFKKYPEEGKNRYFVWSSETSSDKALINKAKSTFNSMENKDGSLIKIILGTRSIMEGVSFKNVKQVHITDPWWNEARIEQILARAVRFCSHSSLPLTEQYTDIFRHYSVLPITPDPNVEEMLIDTIGKKNFKDFTTMTIEQKMIISSSKKLQINNEFEEVLKESAYDCDINQKGNIIRLEEHIRPLNNGQYQTYFRNPKTLINYLREDVPTEISFEEVLNRKYSYPNDKDLPVKFTEGEIDTETNYLVKIKADDSPEIIEKPYITDSLTMYEHVKCWNSSNTFEDIINKMVSDDSNNKEIQDYFNKLIYINSLIPNFRTNILGQKLISKNKIKFSKSTGKNSGKNKLLSCLKNISNDDTTSLKQQKLISKLLKTSESSQIIDDKISKIIYEFKILGEDMIEELQTLDSKQLNEIIKEHLKK